MNRLLLSLSKAAKRAILPIALRYVGWCSIAVLAATPALGAERVYVTYGPLEISVPVKSLELFVETGAVDNSWDGFTQYVNQEQLAQLRQALQAKAEVSPVTISQFLYTDQGEVLLQRLGRVIQTQGRQPGFYAIRAALILAAADPEGLTPMNVLRKFPTYGIRIDIARGLAIVNQLTGLVNRSNRAIAGVIQLANAEAASESPINSSGLPDPQRRGSFIWEKVSLMLTDDRRGRTFPFDLYLPTGNTKPAPVIVISHGVGSGRTSWAYLAAHLASYGFVVAVPEHPGSNAQQLQDLVAGRANEVAQAAEFVERPLDVKYLLDFLSDLSESDPQYQGQMDLQRVGVIGQSFGGYTALVLAGGGGVNFDQLDKDCQQESETWNISLLLQCRVRTLPRKDYNLIDSRIKAAIAVNPIVSSVMGEANISQIKIPVMILASSADTVAPAVIEQIQPFTWLTNPEKYLVLLNNGTHFSAIDESPEDVFRIPANALGPEPALARRYLNGLSVAFMETYLLNQSNFRRNLQPSYAKAISRDTLGLSILRSLTPQQFQQLLGGMSLPASTVSPPQPVPTQP